MNKVTNDAEALVLCKENQMKIEYKRDASFNRDYVVVTLGFKEVAGKTLVEAVNRITDLYHNAPVNYEKLEWYQESQKYLNGKQ